MLTIPFPFFVACGSAFEIHHGVNIRDEALVNAAVLSNRYISDRFLPDKAIDLVDEACAMIRTRA